MTEKAVKPVFRRFVDHLKVGHSMYIEPEDVTADGNGGNGGGGGAGGASGSAAGGDNASAYDDEYNRRFGGKPPWEKDQKDEDAEDDEEGRVTEISKNEKLAK